MPPVTELTGPPLASPLVPRSFLPDAQGLVCEGAAGLCPRVCTSGITFPVIEQTNFAAISDIDGFVCEDDASAFPTCVAGMVGPPLRNSPILRHSCSKICKSVCKSNPTMAVAAVSTALCLNPNSWEPSNNRRPT